MPNKMEIPLRKKTFTSLYAPETSEPITFLPGYEERERRRRNLLSLPEIATERRKNGAKILADYEINWTQVVIGVSPGHLKKLEPTIRGLAEATQPHSLGILLLVASQKDIKKNDFPKNVEAISVGNAVSNWLRDKFFPTASGLVELPGPKYNGELTEYILQRYSQIALEIYPGASFLRGGDIMVAGDYVLVGGITWNCLLNNLKNIGVAEEFLGNFFGKEARVVPWQNIQEEDIPIPCLDLDSFLTIVNEKQILVGEEVNPSRCPRTSQFLESVAESLRETGFQVSRLPFDGERQRTYNNCLIHGPKKLVFVPQYGERDELYPQAAEVYKSLGFQCFPIPFLASFSRRNFGQIRCLTLPLPEKRARNF